MSLFDSASKRQINIGLTVLRVIIGTVFFMHGYQKLFVYGFSGVAGAFAQMGITAPQILGPFVGFVELFGGLALIFGLLTRVAAFGLAVDMLVAMLQVHLANGFFAPKGVELVLSLFAPALMLAFTGAGQWSIDAIIGRKKTVVTSADRSQIRRAA